MLNKGNIVLVPFPFTDLTGSKLRPALVLHSYLDDVIVAFISSSARIISDYDILIRKSKKNGLKVDSVLKLNKVITLDKKLIVGKIGDLEKDILKQVNETLLKMFEIQ